MPRKKAEEPRARIDVNVPLELVEALKCVARDNNKTVDDVVRGILKGWLRCAGYLEREEKQILVWQEAER